jgi:hypothetical protein
MILWDVVCRVDNLEGWTVNRSSGRCPVFLRQLLDKPVMIRSYAPSQLVLVPGHALHLSPKSPPSGRRIFLGAMTGKRQVGFSNFDWQWDSSRCQVTVRDIIPVYAMGF